MLWIVIYFFLFCRFSNGFRRWSIFIWRHRRSSTFPNSRKWVEFLGGEMQICKSERKKKQLTHYFFNYFNLFLFIWVSRFSNTIWLWWIRNICHSTITSKKKFLMKFGRGITFFLWLSIKKSSENKVIKWKIFQFNQFCWIYRDFP